MATAPAFKDWLPIVEALGSGRQIIILRKGGIAEGRGGFRVQADRFWLFPTAFHADASKLKPEALALAAPAAPNLTSTAASTPPPTPADDSPAGTPAPSPITLRYFADLVTTRFIDNWTAVERLDPFHLWSPATIRERFDWSRPPGLHLLVVRVHRLLTPLPLAPDPAYGGCKSWLNLPAPFASHPARPVLSDAEFAATQTTLSRSA